MQFERWVDVRETQKRVQVVNVLFGNKCVAFESVGREVELAQRSRAREEVDLGSVRTGH